MNINFNSIETLIYVPIGNPLFGTEGAYHSIEIKKTEKLQKEIEKLATPKWTLNLELNIDLVFLWSSVTFHLILHGLCLKKAVKLERKTQIRDEA